MTKMSKIKLVNKIIDIDNSRIIYNKPLDELRASLRKKGAFMINVLTVSM